MNQLHIYPTSRALRKLSQSYKEQDGFVPTLMRMDEFEKRVVLVDEKIEVDALERMLLLRQAARQSVDALKKLHINLSLVDFFTRSEALLKFYEEMTAEDVCFEKLAEADVYAEFSEHLEVLEHLLADYRVLLEQKGLTDKIFTPDSYSLHEGFLQNFSRIEIYLEGYLSRFELSLLQRVSEYVPLHIHYVTSTFNVKMQERFQEIGIVLPPNSHTYFSLSQKKLLKSSPNHNRIDVKVYALQERQEQIAVAFREIEIMVQRGISPEDIVLILPDERFKEQFRLFDAYNNLNFAMGFEYSKGVVYRSLEVLYGYWQGRDDVSSSILECYGLQLEEVDAIDARERVNFERFFALLDRLGLHDVPLGEGTEQKGVHEDVYEAYVHFGRLLKEEKFSYKEWLFLWLKSLSKITIDDVGGGKITVMGVLETRGVSFEGVVIVDFNEGIVPATSSKDQFLNSQVRAFANLPTRQDREALQKQYYKRLLEQAKEAVVLYATSDNRLPSKFLYELGLHRVEERTADFALLYSEPSQRVVQADPRVEHFDATAITWSASRLKTFLECKRKYYYRYIKNITPKEDDALNEGAFLHHLLHHLFDTQHYFVTEEQMQKEIDVLLERLLPFEDATIAYQKLLWREKLKGFVSSQIDHFAAGWRVVEREREWHAEIGGLHFKGRIDRIDQHTTDTLVLDYKSGSVEKEPQKLNPDKITDFQMPIYHQLLQKSYRDIRLAYLKIFEKEPMQEVTLLEERTELLFEKIAELKQTQSFVAEKCEELQRCKWCEYALMCERGEYA